MSRRRLPPWVKSYTTKSGNRYRGWAVIQGVRRWTKSFLTPDEAYRAALELRTIAGAADSTIGATLGDARAAVLAEVGLKRTDGTLRWYRGHFAILERTWPPETPLVAIGPEAIDEFVRERLRDVSPATVNADLTALHRIFAVAVRKGWVVENPVRRVVRPRADRAAIDWYTEDELAAILDRLGEDPASRDLVALLAYTGIRRSEAGRLAVRDANLTTMQLWVRGKRGTRTLPIAVDLLPVIQRLQVGKEPDDPLIDGGVRALDKVFRNWGRRMRDRRFHAHTMRHSFATALVRSGVRVDVVRYLLGHATLQMTLRYFHLAGDDVAAAVQHLRLLPRGEQEQA